jgi:hypothetical protein
MSEKLLENLFSEKIEENKLSRDYYAEIENLLLGLAEFSTKKPSMSQKDLFNRDLDYISTFYVGQFIDLIDDLKREIYKTLFL